MGLAVLLAAVVLGSCSTARGATGPVEEPSPTPSESTAPETPRTAPPVPPPLTAVPRPEIVREPPPPPPASRDALAATLSDLLDLATAAAPDVALGVLVVDEHGREVAVLEPDRPLLPASTLKSLTAAGVLTTLGRDGALVTAVDATAGIGPDGTLDGDLVLVGAGDPTLATDEYGRYVYPARPRTRLADLADQLAAAGLRQVTGALHATAPGFDGESLPTGWLPDYLSALDGRHIAGLTVDGGLRTILTFPEPDEPDGEDADGEDDDGTDAVTTSDDDPLTPPVTPAVPEVAPVVRVDLALDPAAHAAAELIRLLAERDIAVTGGVAPPADPAASEGGSTGPGGIVGRLASVRSPSVVDLLRFTVQRSDNHLADQLFQVLGRVRTGQGSWERGERALLQVLERLGVPTDGAVFADGSGLSRDDRVTARMLVGLDRAMTDDPRFTVDWRSFQAVAGQAGTLQTRLVGTPAVGRFLGKTGTLRDVASVAGQVIGADVDPTAPPVAGERRYHLAVVANDADFHGRSVARTLMDEIVLALVADLDGCRTVPVGEANGPLGRPPSAVRCDAA